MNVLYEEEGEFKAGAVLSQSPASFQVESPHGRRTKIKAANVVLSFERPSAGELLAEARKFAEGLSMQFTRADMVSRWGGDEFAVVVGGDLKEAEKRADAVKEWVLGEYKLSVGGQTVKVMAGASIGVVEWNGMETGSQLLERADKGLYAGKAASRTAARPRPY